MFEVPQPATALHRFAETHHDAIQNAAFLLGGQAALCQVQKLLDDLSRRGHITRRMLREAASLHALFAGNAPGERTGLNPRGLYSDDVGLLAEAFAEAMGRSRPQTSRAPSAGTAEEISHD